MLAHWESEIDKYTRDEIMSQDECYEWGIECGAGDNKKR